MVYSLREELARDPEQVRVVQAVSLDRSKPNMGLSPKPALYGSEAWWRCVETGAIKRRKYAGTITRLYFAGMDGDRSKPNSFIMATDDGGEFGWSMIANDASNKSLYTVGRRIEVTTILVELKRRQSIWKADYMESPLEISIQRRAPHEDTRS